MFNTGLIVQSVNYQFIAQAALMLDYCNRIMVDRVPELVRVNIASMTDRIGIPLLAQRIALGPDYEAFIFRKFDQLSARNLLHLESRLGYLEYKLDQADRQAEHGLDNETRRSIRAWEAFEENAKDKDRPGHAWMKIVEEVT